MTEFLTGLLVGIALTNFAWGIFKDVWYRDHWYRRGYWQARWDRDHLNYWNEHVTNPYPRKEVKQ